MPLGTSKGALRLKGDDQIKKKKKKKKDKELALVDDSKPKVCSTPLGHLPVFLREHTEARDAVTWS